MNGAILRRTRLVTLIAAAGLSVALALLVSPRFAVGVFATAAWATAGFWMLDGLTRRALVPPGSPRATGPIAALVAGKVLLYGIAVWALFSGVVPPVSCLIGFSLLLIVLLAVTALTRHHAPGGPKATRGHDA